MRIKDLSDWEVVGPEGEYYGRYKTEPSPDQIPLYAIAKRIDPNEWRMQMGALDITRTVTVISVLAGASILLWLAFRSSK